MTYFSTFKITHGCMDEISYKWEDEIIYGWGGNI